MRHGAWSLRRCSKPVARCPGPGGIGNQGRLERLRAYVCLFVAVLSWGLEYPLLKRATDAVGPLTTGAVMFGTSALLLGLTAAWRLAADRRQSTSGLRGLPYRWLLLIGCIGAVVNLLALFAIKLTRVVNVATLARSDAFFSLLLSAFVFRERVPRRAWLFAPVMLMGIGCITGFLTQPLELGNPGDYVILGSALFVSVNAYVIKRTVQGVSGVVIGFVNAGIIALTFLLFTVCMVGFGSAFRSIPRHIWVYLVVLGFLAYVFFASYNTALRSVPVWQVRVTCLLIPVVAALTGWLWLGEAPTAVQIVGMLLISGGAAGVILSRRGRKCPSSGLRHAGALAGS